MFKKRRSKCAWLLAALLLVVLGSTGGFAHRAAAAEEGSITYTLAYGGQALSGVEITLYKVGSMDGAMFTIDSAYDEAGVDLMQISDSDELALAAYRLQAIAKGNTTAEAVEGGTAGQPPYRDPAMTDANGVCSFTGLEYGVYLLSKTGGDESVRLQPTIVTVPQFMGGNEYTDVQVTGKATVETQPVSVTVTKHIVFFAQDTMSLYELYAESADYTVGIFYDPDGLCPVEGDYIRTIHIEGGNSSSVTFDGLTSGTYYVFELDKYGNPIIPEVSTEDEDGNGFTCYITLEDGTSSNVLELDVNEGIFEHQISVENSYVDWPDAYFVNGQIVITKSVLRGTDRVDTDEVFYAAVYKQNRDTNELELFKVVPLVNNGSVTVDVELGKPGSGTYVYYVVECDEYGNDVETSEYFPYVFTVTDEGEVVMNVDNAYLRESYITITNTEVTPTPTPTPVPTETPTPVPTDTPTPTPIPTDTPTPIPSATPTPTPVVTATPTPAITVTVTPTPVITVTVTPTPVVITVTSPPNVVTVTSPPNVVIITRPPGGTTTTNVNETYTSNVTQHTVAAPTGTPPVRTGDDTPIGLYVVLLVAAAGLITILVIRRRGRK